jgi:hypothetical protein
MSDLSTLDVVYDGDESAWPPILSGVFLPVVDARGIDDFSSPWWPRGGSGLVADTALSDVLRAVWFESVYPVSGANGRYAIAGVTRDATGSALGGCTVRLFVTGTDELVARVTSDANGAYIATSPYSVGTPHYMTVHFGGTVAGASVDTLIPG